jgi:hypothetical protein
MLPKEGLMSPPLRHLAGKEGGREGKREGGREERGW